MIRLENKAAVLGTCTVRRGRLQEFCIFHLRVVTAAVRDAPSRAQPQRRVAECSRERRASARRANRCSRHPSDKAEPQQTSGTSDFANEDKAVPRTSPITQASQPPSPRLCVDWMRDFIRTLNSEAVKSLCKKTNYTYFCNSQFKLAFRSPHIPLHYIKHFFHLKCSFLKAISLNLIDA